MMKVNGVEKIWASPKHLGNRRRMTSLKVSALSAVDIAQRGDCISLIKIQIRPFEVIGQIAVQVVSRRSGVKVSQDQTIGPSSIADVTSKKESSDMIKMMWALKDEGEVSRSGPGTPVKITQQRRDNLVRHPVSNEKKSCIFRRSKSAEVLHVERYHELFIKWTNSIGRQMWHFQRSKGAGMSHGGSLHMSQDCQIPVFLNACLSLSQKFPNELKHDAFQVMTFHPQGPLRALPGSSGWN